MRILINGKTEETNNINLNYILENKKLFKSLGKGFFFDWFCTDRSLDLRGERLMVKLCKVIKANNGKFNPEKCYTFFKNNCPCSGHLYDDFRICDKETRDVLYTIIPASGHYSEYGKAVVYGRDNDFKEPLIIGTFEDVLSFFRGN